jgi:catechol 2,3-dioxygenase-like lactoylglutathione lyase family enzyme
VEVLDGRGHAASRRVCGGHFIVSDDVERSRRFYTEVLGGRVVFSPTPTVVVLANTWVVINTGGGPTDDKPTVTAYAEWSARGAQFLTPPKQHPYETRCFIRDPDGYLIEVGQTTDPEGDWSAGL